MEYRKHGNLACAGADVAKVLRTVVPQTMLLTRKKNSKMNPIGFQREISLSFQRDELTAASVDFFDAPSSEPSMCLQLSHFLADQSRKQKS